MEPLTIYSTASCADRRRLKSFLKHHGIDFQEVNIEEDPQAEAIVLRANHGKRKVPTLKVGDSYFTCSPFDVLQLAERLQISLNK
jgi:mycoredoxin